MAQRTPAVPRQRASDGVNLHIEPGVYFCRLQAGGVIETSKVVLDP